MNWLLTLVLAFVVIFSLMSIKHSLHFRFKRILYFLLFFFIALAVVSSYVNISGFFGKGNFFAETGAAFFLDVKEAVGEREDTVKAVKGEISDHAEVMVEHINDLPVGYSISKKQG